MPDGRRLYRITASAIPATVPDGIAEPMAAARQHGATLVADGPTLVLVAPAHGLPHAILARLAADPGGTIAALRAEPFPRGRIVAVHDSAAPAARSDGPDEDEDADNMIERIE